MPTLADLLAPTEKHLKYTGGCASCPRGLKDFVPPTLRQSKIILIGEAPGATEVEEQEGFRGKSGQTIRGALKDVGIPSEECSWSNAIHCRPPENRDPTPKEISCCMNQHVLHEASQYFLVVLVGNVAANAFFPAHVQQVRGNLAYHPDFPNTRFYTTLHPAAIGYDPRRKDEFYRQFDRLGRIFRGDTEAKFKVVEGTEFRQKWALFLEQSVLISLDIETDRLESWEPEGKIKSFAACGLKGDEVFVIDSSDPFWAQALDLLAAFLQNPDKQVLGKNIGFDLVWIEAKKKIKCNVKYIHDLQPLYYELNGDRDLGLKPIVADKLDGYRHLVVWPHLEKDPVRLKKYNSEDVAYPAVLFAKDFPELRPKQRDLMLRVLGPSSLATARIRHAGIHFRSQAWEALDTEFQNARKREIAEWQAEDPQFDPKKYVTEKGFKDLEEYLFAVKQFPILSLTPKDQKPSTDDATIKELIRLDGKRYEPTGMPPRLVQGTAVLKHCLAVKGIDKRKSTYINAYPKLIGKDRRIHASYHNTTVLSSRLSSSNPNMQNIPRKEPQWQNQIRWLFGAPPGCKFGGGDFSQIELRIAMCLAGDPTGLEVYRTGGDIHLASALSMLGMPVEFRRDLTQARVETGSLKKAFDLLRITEEIRNKIEDARTKAKPVNFGLVYGAQWQTLQEYAANQYGVILTDAEAKRWGEVFFGTYYKLPEWHESERQKFRENKGYVESATGHVWFWPDWDSKDDGARAHAERSALNMTCQGPAANMMTYLVYLAQQAFWQNDIRSPALGFADIVLSVHDSLYWEVAQEQAEESLQIVHKALHTVEEWVAPWFSVPLVLDTEIKEIWDG